MKKKTVTLFYVGEKFYAKTGWMGVLYEVGTRRRSDWGKVSLYLKDEVEVKIRLANKKEMEWAWAEYGRTVQQNKECQKVP